MYELLNYYKTELSFKKLILGKASTFSKIIFKIFSAIFFSSPLVFSIISSIYKNSPYLFIYVPAIAIPPLLFTRFVNSILAKKHKKSISKTQVLPDWPQFNDIKVDMLSKYLREHNLDKVEQINILIELLSSKSSQTKFQGAVTKGIFVGGILTISGHIVSWLYSNVQNSQDLVNLSVILMTILIIITITIFILESIIDELKYFIINKESIKCSQLSTLLEHVKLDLLKDRTTVPILVT